jgi:hypothetical protein
MAFNYSILLKSYFLVNLPILAISVLSAITLNIVSLLTISQGVIKLLEAMHRIHLYIELSFSVCGQENFSIC